MKVSVEIRLVMSVHACVCVCVCKFDNSQQTECVMLAGYLIMQTQSFVQLTDSHHEVIEHTEYVLGDTHQ